uniref:Uncharacterized protein n=1 Tax=Oryza brachyantha TaxID=4533 RepID=J3M9W2_ORYBR
MKKDEIVGERFYLKAANADDRVEDLAKYLAMLSLLDHKQFGYGGMPTTVIIIFRRSFEHYYLLGLKQQLDESVKISKATIDILKDQVFGFDTFFVTSQEPYENKFGDQYKLINPEDEKPVAVVVPRQTLQPETTGNKINSPVADVGSGRRRGMDVDLLEGRLVEADPAADGRRSRRRRPMGDEADGGGPAAESDGRRGRPWAAEGQRRRWMGVGVRRTAAETDGRRGPADGGGDGNDSFCSVHLLSRTAAYSFFLSFLAPCSYAPDILA